MFTTQLLHEGTTLFKLAQRSSMEPYILGIRVYLLFDGANGLTFTTPHLAHLLIEKAYNGYATEVKIHDEIVHNAYFRMDMARCMRLMVSSLPKKAEMSNMPGPLPSPTSVSRQAFMILPSLYSFCSIHACTICS